MTARAQPQEASAAAPAAGRTAGDTESMASDLCTGHTHLPKTGSDAESRPGPLRVGRRVRGGFLKEGRGVARQREDQGLSGQRDNLGTGGEVTLRLAGREQHPDSSEPGECSGLDDLSFGHMSMRRLWGSKNHWMFPGLWGESSATK